MKKEIYNELKKELLNNDRIEKVSKKGDYITLELNATDYLYTPNEIKFILHIALMNLNKDFNYCEYENEELPTKYGKFKYIKHEQGNSISLNTFIVYSVTYKII